MEDPKKAPTASEVKTNKDDASLVAAAQAVDVKQINETRQNKGPMRYYRSFAPTFGTIYRHNRTGERVDVHFENQVFKTDNKLVQEYLDRNFVSRNIIIAITETEYNEITDLMAKDSEGRFVDSAQRVINAPPHSVNPNKDPTIGRMGVVHAAEQKAITDTATAAQGTIKTGQSSSADIAHPAQSIAGKK